MSRSEGLAPELLEPEGFEEQDMVVMRLVAEGIKDAVIARRLGVSVVTVRRRARRFSMRLGAKNRTHAVALATALGWLQPTQPAADSSSKAGGSPD